MSEWVPGRHVLTPREAEEMAAHHMRQLGHPDARTNPGRGADGGLDVTASRALAQVKFRGGRAGRPDLQRLYGARADRTDLELWFFTGPGYSDEAVEYADRHAMVLFTFDLAGALTPANRAASDVLDQAAAVLASGRFSAPARDVAAPRRAVRPPRPDDEPDAEARWWDGPQHPAPEPEFTGWRWVSPGRAVRRNLLLLVSVVAAAVAWVVGANVERVEHAAATIERLTGRVVDVGAVFVWSSGVALAAVVLYVVQVAVMFRLGKHPLKVPAGRRRRRRQRERASAR